LFKKKLLVKEWNIIYIYVLILMEAMNI
jgi:hypothetical protein